MSEMQELGKDFKLTKKAGLGDDPAALLKKRARPEAPPPQKAPAEEPRTSASPMKIGGGSRAAGGTGIGGGLKRPGANTSLQ